MILKAGGVLDGGRFLDEEVGGFLFVEERELELGGGLGGGGVEVVAVGDVGGGLVGEVGGFGSEVGLGLGVGD